MARNSRMLGSSSTISMLARMASVPRRAGGSSAGDPRRLGGHDGLDVAEQRRAWAGGGQLDGDRGAAAGSALDPQPAAVVLDDAVDDRHADAGAAVEEGLEGMEQVGPLRRRHAAAGVDDLQPVGVAIEPADEA